MRNLIKKMLSMLMCTIMIAGMIPSEAFAEVVAYDVWIGKHQVTSANKDNIPVNGGSASYDPVNRILRFNNVTGIDGYHQGDLYNEKPKYLIYFAVENLSIQGKLTLDVDDTSIWAVIYGQRTFDMNGDISITTNGATPVSGYRSIRSGGNIDLKNNSNDDGCAISASFEINIYNGKLNCVSKAEYYPARCIYAEDIIISSGEVYAECVGKPALDIDKKLVMDGGKITAYTTKSSYAIDGENTMTMRGGELIATASNGSQAIIFDKGITLDSTLEICDPPSGKLSSDNTTIVDSIGNKAKTVHIRKKGEYCNVVFSMNGGRSSRVIPAQSLLKGEKAERPLDPVWETLLNAKDFGGWYKESECINEFDFNAPIIKDTVIYAKWNPRYTVEFMMNEHGDYRPSNQTVKSGEKAIEPETPSDELYAFRGWYSDKELTKEFSFDTPIIDDTTLYAKWDLSKDFSKAKIVVNGEYVYSDRYKTEHKPAAEDITVTYGNTVLTPGTDYVITGYMNNVYPGKASVIIEGRGSCLGTAVGEFEIKKSKIQLYEDPENENSILKLDGNTTGAKLEDILMKSNICNVKDEEGELIDGTWIWDEPDVTIAVESGKSYKARFVPDNNADCFEDLIIDKIIELYKTTYIGNNTYIGQWYQRLGNTTYELDLSAYIPEGVNATVREFSTNSFVESAYMEGRTLKYKYYSNYAGADTGKQIIIDVDECDDYDGYSFWLRLNRTNNMPQNNVSISPVRLEIEYGDNSKKVTASGGSTSPISLELSGDAVNVDNEGNITTNAVGRANISAVAPAINGFEQGVAKCSVTVVRANIKKAEFALSQDEYTYTGATYKPGVTVTFNDEVLVKDTDYILAYYNCTNAGTATVKVIGKGRFKGYKDLTYTIKPIESKIKSIELHDRLYYPGVKGVGIKSVSFNDANGEDFYLSSVSYNIVAEMADDSAGDDKAANIIVTMLDTNFAVDTSTANAKVTIHKNFLDAEEIKETAIIGTKKQIDLKDKIPAGAKAVLYDYNDTGIFDAVPVVKNGILEVSVADDAESVDKEYFHAVAVRICDIPNYNDTYIYYTITMNDKAATPEEEEQDEEQKDEEQKEKVTTVSENILDPIKLEKVPEGVRLVSGKGGTIKLTVSANGVKVKKWVSSDKKIATVSKKGIVKAKKSGSVIITAHLKDGTKQEFNVLVEVPGIEKKINIVSFNQANLTISDNKIKFNITRFLDKETNKYSEWTGFTSSSKKTCTIDENGVVTILKNGKSTITIKYGKVKVKATVYIKFPDIKNKTVSLAKAGKSKKITLQNCKDKTKVYTLESNDPKVFTVDNEKRKVTAVAKGEAELILKVDGVEYDRCKVKVKK